MVCNRNQFIKTYNIAYYPTFLFFNSDGKIVHRIVGAADANKFIVKASKAIDPQTQYYSLLGKYHEGEKSEKSLYNLALSCLDAYDLETADKVAEEYFNTQKNLYTNDNLALLQSVTTHSGDRGFNMMLNNPDEIDAILGKATSASITRDIIVQEEVAPFLDDAMTNGLIPDWQLLLAKVKLKYDERANEIVTYSRMLFYKQTGTIDSLLNSIQFYFKNYAGYLKPDLANSLAWEVFQSGTDSTLLNETANFCRVILNQNQNPLFMDTYANLLYKLGNIDDAILWEQKAVDLSEGAINGLLENLDKMKKGEKTWQD